MRQHFKFINFNAFFGRLLACFVLFCIVLSSVNVFGSAVTNVVVKDVMQVSAEASLAQFFYISSIPVDIISSLFADSSVNSATSNKSDNNKKSKEANSTKASLGFVISPDISNLLKLQKDLKENNSLLLDNAIGKNSSLNGVLSCYLINSKFYEQINCLFIIMLLLAILISRRNVGDNNIIKKIEYKMQPSFVF